MVTLWLLYDYFCFLQKKKMYKMYKCIKIGFKIEFTVMSPSYNYRLKRIITV